MYFWNTAADAVSYELFFEIFILLVLIESSIYQDDTVDCGLSVQLADQGIVPSISLVLKINLKFQITRKCLAFVFISQFAFILHITHYPACIRRKYVTETSRSHYMHVLKVGLFTQHGKNIGKVFKLVRNFHKARSHTIICQIRIVLRL